MGNNGAGINGAGFNGAGFNGSLDNIIFSKVAHWVTLINSIQ